MFENEKIAGLMNEAKKLEEHCHFPKAQMLREQILRQAFIDYAGNFFGQGKYIAVITLTQKAQEIVLSDKDEFTAGQNVRILRLQALAHEQLGHTLNAIACFEELLSISNKKNKSARAKYDLPSQHLLLESLTKLSLKANNLQAAEKYLASLLEDFQSGTLTMGAARLATFLEELVKKLIENQDYATARIWSRKEVQLQRRHLYLANEYQKSHNYGKALNRLATVCKMLGKFNAAKVLYKAHIKVVGQHLGKQHCELSDSIASLSQLDQTPDEE